MTTQFTFRKNRAGQWVAFGPADAIAAAVGTVADVVRRSGQVVPKRITGTGRPFTVPTGELMAYGYLADPTAAPTAPAAPDAPTPVDLRSRVAEVGGFSPTDEQVAVIDAFLTGQSLIVQAYAGAGKTTVLRLAAILAGGRRGYYTAFNRAIVDDGKAKMPRNVKSQTAHAIALAHTPPKFRARFEACRDQQPQSNTEVARMLGITGQLTFTVDGATKVYGPSKLAGFAMAAVRAYCQSGDLEPDGRHVATIPTISDRDNAVLARTLTPYVRAAWADLSTPTGRLHYGFAHFLKQFANSGTVLNGAFLAVDEAQDLSPVMLQIVRTQLDAGIQVVLVGDSFQAINGFTGAVDAMEALADRIPTVRYLTKSWRFGPAIADAANVVLDKLGATKPLVGNEAMSSTVGPIDRPRCLLTRTNAAAVAAVLGEIADGGRPKLIGNDKEIQEFAEGAVALQAGREATKGKLAWFSTWGEAKAWADTDEGEDIRLMVQVVEEFGAAEILAAVRAMPKHEDDATLIVSTAHKVKGREWDTVRLDGAIGRGLGGQPSDDELMLLYVAMTRGRLHSDFTAVALFADAGPAGAVALSDDDPDLDAWLAGV
jgi:hypothetical protein